MQGDLNTKKKVGKLQPMAEEVNLDHLLQLLSSYIPTTIEWA